MHHEPIRHCLFDCALGLTGIAWSPRGVTRLQLPEKDHSSTERRLAARSSSTAAEPPALIAEAIRQLQSYFTGAPVELDAIALDLDGVGTFHRVIYARTRRLRWGETATYGEIARQAGAPGAARAVGHAMARNRIPVIIPCHRVLASGDKMGGFSAYGGVITKQRLLELEGVYPGSGTPLLPGLLSDGG